MTYQIGDIVESEKILSNGNVLKIKGVIYGREKSFGGFKWLLKEVSIIEPKIIGVRKIK